MHRVRITAIFETGTTQSDCNEALETCTKMFYENVKSVSDFSVSIIKVEIEPLTEGSARALKHSGQCTGTVDET